LTGVRDNARFDWDPVKPNPTKRDRVSGQTVNTNIWYNAYKVFLVFWIMFGLGYLFMILSFISRAMRSKTLEHLFLERLKQTHTKIWHQFTKDVVYIRRILNESYLLKFKVRFPGQIILSYRRRVVARVLDN
jgi:DNA integrity scanning protein DisA with diadenylate cyclase activity